MNHSLIGGSERWTILLVIRPKSRWQFRRFRHESRAESPSAIFCEVAHWVPCCAAFHLVPLVPTMSNIDNLDDCGEKKRSFGSFWEGLLCAVLRIVVATCPKRAVDFVRIRSFLVKMCLSLISYEFFICNMHTQLLWWNIAVGNFRPTKQNLLTIVPLLMSCWWHDKHVSPLDRHVPIVLTFLANSSNHHHLGTGRWCTRMALQATNVTQSFCMKSKHVTLLCEFLASCFFCKLVENLDSLQIDDLLLEFLWVHIGIEWPHVALQVLLTWLSLRSPSDGSSCWEVDPLSSMPNWTNNLCFPSVVLIELDGMKFNFLSSGSEGKCMRCRWFILHCSSGKSMFEWCSSSCGCCCWSIFCLLLKPLTRMHC